MPRYGATLLSLDPSPAISFLGKTSAFAQSFNPTWVAPSAATEGASGLLVRSQNCTPAAPGKCIACSGAGRFASVIAFAKLLSNDNASGIAPPSFTKLDAAAIVFGPHDDTDDLGTEDPRLHLDPLTGVYYLFYTCYNSGRTLPRRRIPRVTLCLATTRNPTSSSRWTRHGPLGFGENSKSAALAFGYERPGAERGEHLLYWGSGAIRLSRSRNLSHWADRGQPFLTNTSFGNQYVEAGPPPMRLSTGDFVLFHNSWSAGFPAPPGYEPAWVVLAGDDLSRIVARAQAPLWGPQRAPYMTGAKPALCNVPNVAFVEAAHPTDQPDVFRLYFGGADAVVGSAVVRMTLS